MAQGAHMHPELVAPPRKRSELKSGRGRLAFEQPPVGLRGFAALETYHLQRPVGPVADQRQVDAAGLALHLPGDPRHIGLAQLPTLELPADMALSEARSGEKHHARGIAVETVDQQRLRVDSTHPDFQAIGRARWLRRHAQEARGLVENKEMGIGMENANARRWGGVMIQVKSPSLE